MRTIAERQAKLIAETAGQGVDQTMVLLIICIALIIILIVALLVVVYCMRRSKDVIRAKAPKGIPLDDRKHEQGVPDTPIAHLRRSEVRSRPAHMNTIEPNYVTESNDAVS